MCRPVETGWHGENGMLHISEEPLTTADRKILEELEHSSVSQLDLYYTRRDFHKLEQKLDALEIRKDEKLTNLQSSLNRHIADHDAFMAEINEFKKEMRAALFIPVRNGTERLASVGEISLINYQSLKLYRDVNKVYNVIKDHKWLMIFLVLTIIFFSKDIGEFISFAIHWIISLRDFIIPN